MSEFRAVATGHGESATRVIFEAIEAPNGQQYSMQYRSIEARNRFNTDRKTWNLYGGLPTNMARCTPWYNPEDWPEVAELFGWKPEPEVISVTFDLPLGTRIEDGDEDLWTLKPDGLFHCHVDDDGIIPRDFFGVLDNYGVKKIRKPKP